MNTLIESWRVASADWLDKQAAADILDDCKNDKLAELTTHSLGKSHAEKERNARISADWKEYRRAVVDAKDAARRARLKMKYFDMKWGEHISAEANARSERKSY